MSTAIIPSANFASEGTGGERVSKNPPQHSIDCIRRYILAAGRKFTGRQYGTARVLIHYRPLLESYVLAKKRIQKGKTDDQCVNVS